MGSWERFKETSLPDKGAFYSSLNMKVITGVDCWYPHKLFEEFKLKNLGEYHDLYLQSDTLLLADVFENFRNKCIERYHLNPAYFFICTWISIASLFKKDSSKIRIINRY